MKCTSLDSFGDCGTWIVIDIDTRLSSEFVFMHNDKFLL